MYPHKILLNKIKSVPFYRWGNFNLDNSINLFFVSSKEVVEPEFKLRSTICQSLLEINLFLLLRISSYRHFEHETHGLWQLSV